MGRDATWFLIAGVLLSSGCASVTRGTMDSLVVESDPSGASVEIYRTDRKFTRKEAKVNKVGVGGAIVGNTPSSFGLKREGSYRVVVSKHGYETVESTVSHSVSNQGARGMAGNIILGGVIGAVVDANTGAMHSLHPNPLKVILAPVAGISNPGSSAEKTDHKKSAGKDNPERSVSSEVGPDFQFSPSRK